MSSQSQSQQLLQSQFAFVWSDARGADTNRYVAFRREIHLEGPPGAATLHLFADTRYRLIVNGSTLCHGPARFARSHPQYDSVDIRPYLKTGRNVIAILVNSYAYNSFHSDISRGAMGCRGEIELAGRTIAFDSRSGWKCLPLDAYRRDTHAMSFALNRAEQLDARILPHGWDSPGFDDSAWQTPVAVADPANWGELRPRSIPMLDEREILPRRRLATFVARPDRAEIVASFMLDLGSGEGRPRSAMLVATWIHSPRPQQLMLGAWWGEYAINGRKIQSLKRHDIALRQDFPVELNEGWNLLMLRESTGQNTWDFHLAHPAMAGLTLCATRDLDSPDQFLVAGPFTGEDAQQAQGLALEESSISALPASLGRWRPIPRTHSASSPVRDRAWKRFEQLDSTPDLLCDGGAYANVIGKDTLVLLYDFGIEFLGRLKLDCGAAEGTVVDVTYSEKLRNDGVADVHNRFFQDMAERYTARAGRQVWHLMHPRGGRYVEVLVKGDIGAFRLHGITMTRAAYPVREIGHFDCGDPVLKDIWELGKRTQAACMEDAYLDCPMRERGLYAGDMLVQYMVNLATFGDHHLMRRCLEVFFYRQHPGNGLVAGGAFGLPTGRHPDYSAILIQAIWQYYHHTGDKAWVAKMEPWFTKTLRGLAGLKVNGSDLLDGSDLHPYIDLQKMDRGGINCALNCFYQKAFADAVSIYTLIGNSAAAKHCADLAARLAQAIREEFWDAARGVFTDRRKADVVDPQPSVAANALPLLYDIASPEQAALAINYLADAMADNFLTPIPMRNEDCRVTSYFSYYAIGALVKHGRAADALAFIRKYWGYMVDRGAWTCWEYFEENGSLCHAWSAAPTHYLSRLLLGVDFPEAGNPMKVAVSPLCASLDWASGTYPHPAGAIRVRWRKVAGLTQLDVQAPAGVEIIT